MSEIDKKNGFMLGCNYWASNAGVYMWRRFDETAVRKDLRFLSEYGVNTIRIFPLWPDFQPIERVLCRSTGSIRMFSEPLPDTGLGRSGVDEGMMQKFKKVLDIAAEYGFRVIVALLTGWMSGRLFLPSAIENENPITSALSLRWQKRFVKTFVKHFKNEPSVIAWEHGNECNCMGAAANADESAAWLSAIADAIRSEDCSRPVYSGMHGLSCEDVWRIEDAAEHTDMLTIHPYPLFTPHCGKEGLVSMRAALHAAAESAYYSGVGNKPCLVEEIGTLGPMVLSDDYVGEYTELSLVTSLAYGATGYLWWCAFDQNKFDFSPYDSCAAEQDLGFAYTNDSAKKSLLKIKEQAARISALAVPPPKKDAVVILSKGQDQWGAAFGAFTLGVQSGVTLDFMYEGQRLKDSGYYILPCIKSTEGIPKRLKLALSERVEAGANLLITYDGGYIGNFEGLTGLRAAGREDFEIRKTFDINGSGAEIKCDTSLDLVPACAEVLLRDSEGNILLSKNKYGKGFVYFLNAPLERRFSEIQYPADTGLYNIYKLFFKDRDGIIEFDSKYCAATVHDKGEGEKLIIAVNLGKESGIPFTLKEGFKISRTLFCTAKDKQIHFEGKWAALYVNECSRKVP